VLKALRQKENRTKLLRSVLTLFFFYMISTIQAPDASSRIDANYQHYNFWILRKLERNCAFHNNDVILTPRVEISLTLTNSCALNYNDWLQ